MEPAADQNFTRSKNRSGNSFWLDPQAKLSTINCLYFAPAAQGPTPSAVNTISTASEQRMSPITRTRTDAPCRPITRRIASEKSNRRAIALCEGWSATAARGASPINRCLLAMRLSVRTHQVPDHALIAGISLPGFPLEEFQG